MTLGDILKKPLRRLVPQEGMVVDVQTWNAAHDYHNVNQRLHAASMHSFGVVTGLEVVAWDPPDNSVVINPGVAVDAEGGTIIVSEALRFQLDTTEAGTTYLILQYREIPQDSNGTAGAVHVQYVLEAYRVEERRQLPAESYIELARIEISGSGTSITEPLDPYNPGRDEIDMRHRAMSGPRAIGEIRVGVIPLETTSGGHIVHASGASSLIRDINKTRYQADFKGSINLNEDIANCDLVIVAGRSDFTLTDEWIAVLGRFIERGGVILGEGCGASGEDSSPFKQAFSRLSDQLGKEMNVVERGHPLFTAYNLFAKPPDGADGTAPLIVAGDGIVYSDGDYGCLWEGGSPNSPASREAIREAIELGVNIGVFASQRIHTRSVRLMA